MLSCLETFVLYDHVQCATLHVFDYVLQTKRQTPEDKDNILSSLRLSGT